MVKGGGSNQFGFQDLSSALHMDPWPRAWSEYGADRQRLLADMMAQSRSLIDGLFGEST